MTTRKILSVVVAASVLAGQAQTYYGNGYTIIEQGTVDDRLSGLDAMVFKSIDAYSVQEGLEQLLQGSGWALAGADNADPQIWRLYRQPWPDNKRTLNPMPLSQALSWVAGDGWSLVIDPVNRLVSFEVNARYAARPTPAAATVANAPADAALPPATGYTRVTPTNPYTAIVSYADSPSYAASHGDSFHDSSYTASANALMVSPPDYHDGYNPPPRQTVRDTKPLRPAAANIADLKTVSAGTGAGKTPSASGKNRRKTADSPALLPVATDEKTTSRTTSRIQKNAGAATATNPVATTATGKKAAAQAATAPKSAAATATDTAKKSAADSAAQAAASSGKTAAPATEPAKKGATGAPDAAAPAATAQQTATTPATGTKTGAPALLHEKPSATPAQTTATNSHSGENRP